MTSSLRHVTQSSRIYLPLHSLLKPHYMISALGRTIQLKDQLTDGKQPKMSNNQDLVLNKVFNVKGKIALVTGGGSGIGLMVRNQTQLATTHS